MNRKPRDSSRTRRRYGTAPRDRTKVARRREMPLKRWLDRFRVDEASTIVVNSAVALVALALLLGIFFLIRPQLELSYASHLARTGDVDRAEAYIAELERKGHSPGHIDDIRAKLSDRLIAEGDYDAALLQAGMVSDGERARACEQRVNYAHAASLYDQKDYEAAARLFYPLGAYEDAPERYALSRCSMAVNAFLAGHESEARYLLLDVDGAEAFVERAALDVTGDAQQARALLSRAPFSPDALRQMEADKRAASAARAEYAHHRLAAGYRHTVGLRSDGTVLAAGSNENGQCDVSDWTDIVEVAAGAAHTVGLRADGTVVATGDDSYGQCDVAGWTGIRAIAAGAYGTLGLLSDGAVVATRAYADRVSGWRNVTQIAAGSYSAGGLYGQGSMVCTHPGARLELGASLFGLSVCGPVSAALLPDGSLYSNYASAPDWRALTQIAVGQSGMIGVFSDGSCRGFIFRDNQEVALDIDAQVVEAASSGTHHVLRASDGRVFAYGANADGQCGVSGWSLE